VQSADPQVVSLSEVTWHLIVKFGMDFINGQASR